MPNLDATSSGKIPLGLCKQALMKLESALGDINEIREDPDLDEETKYQFEQMAEIAGNMMAAIVNIVSREMGEEEFVAETIAMDPVDPFPDQTLDLDEPMDVE